MPIHSGFSGWVDHHVFGDQASDFGNKLGLWESGYGSGNDALVSGLIGAGKLIGTAYSLVGLGTVAITAKAVAGVEALSGVEVAEGLEASSALETTSAAASKQAAKLALQKGAGRTAQKITLAAANVIARRTISSAAQNVVIGAGMKLLARKSYTMDDAVDDAISGALWTGGVSRLSSELKALRIARYGANGLRLWLPVTKEVSHMPYSVEAIAEHIKQAKAPYRELRQWATDQFSRGWHDINIGGDSNINWGRMFRPGFRVAKNLGADASEIAIEDMTKMAEGPKLTYEPAFSLNPWSWWKGGFGQWSAATAAKSANMVHYELAGSLAIRRGVRQIPDSWNYYFGNGATHRDPDDDVSR